MVTAYAAYPHARYTLAERERVGWGSRGGSQPLRFLVDLAATPRRVPVLRTPRPNPPRSESFPSESFTFFIALRTVGSERPILVASVVSPSRPSFTNWNRGRPGFRVQLAMK